MADAVKIQLLYFAGCPNVDEARAALQRAVARTATTERVEEIDVGAEGAPDALRAWGSPTVLINGVDVGGGAGAGPSCRIYRDADGQTRGAPSEAELVAALQRAGLKQGA
jgi:hypothetical protein